MTKPNPVGVPESGASAPAPAAEQTAVHFGLSHALVIICFVVTAAVLSKLGMPVNTVLALLAGAGAIGVAVVLAIIVPSRNGGRLARALRAYLTAGN